MLFMALALIGNNNAYSHGFLRDGQQSTFHGGHGSTGTRVNMNDALDVFPGLVNGRVNEIASAVDS